MRDCVPLFCRCLLALPYGRATQRQKLVTGVCVLRVRDRLLSDKKALSRKRGVWGVKTPHEDPASADALCASSAHFAQPAGLREARSLFPTQAHGKAVRNSLATRYGVSVTLTLMFYEYTTNFLVTKRRCRAKGGCGGLKPPTKTPRQRACVSTLSVREHNPKGYAKRTASSTPSARACACATPSQIRLSRVCVCLCSPALFKERASQRQTYAFLHWRISTDKKALSRKRGVWGVKTPHEDPASADALCASSARFAQPAGLREARSLFPTQAHGKAVRNSLATRYGVSVTLTLMFYEYTTNF